MWKSLKKVLRKSDSLISLIVGFVIVIIIGVLSYSIISSIYEQNQNNQKLIHNESTLPTKYTVKKDDTLWDIAIQFYQSGYNWVDIASENKLNQPDYLEIGQTLTIPNVKPIDTQGDILDGATTDTVTTHVNQITVVEGDSLWSISERTYGTGYKWVDIVQVNSLISDPNLIYPNTVLRLP